MISELDIQQDGREFGITWIDVKTGKMREAFLVPRGPVDDWWLLRGPASSEDETIIATKAMIATKAKSAISVLCDVLKTLDKE